MIQHFTNLFVSLEEREHAYNNWAYPWLINRALSIFLGLPAAAIFSLVCWSITDKLVPVSGTNFAAVWTNLGFHPTLDHFFAALDQCGLRETWDYRLYIVGAASVLAFGYGAGEMLRKLIVGAYTIIQIMSGLMYGSAIVMLIALTITWLMVIHRPARGDAALCVQQLQVSAPF